MGATSDHPELVVPSAERSDGYVELAAVTGDAPVAGLDHTASNATAMRPEAPSSSLEKPQERTNVRTSPSNSTTYASEPPAAAPFPNGYHFPPSHTFGHSTKLGMIGFWKYFTTPLGFCVTVYGLNIVAWGGMLFLLLCNAGKYPFLYFLFSKTESNFLLAPAMCHPSCNHIDSPRRKWIEWDAQILNALFCVTGFGLAPWRFRDLYYLMRYRILKDSRGLRRLAGIHRGWFRLPGSEALPADLGPHNIPQQVDVDDSYNNVPFPEAKIPDAPLTGVRAPASRVWKMDLVVWLMVWNTFFQICLAAFMWTLNRYDRPSWATGLFVALACIVGAVGGYFMFAEGKAIKSIEGVPLSQEDIERLESDRISGIYHFNNIKAKDPEAKAKTKAKGTDQRVPQGAA